MPSLQVRDLPEHIYQTLCTEAARQHRSIAQQAIATLAQGLKLDVDPRLRRIALLETIRAKGYSVQTDDLTDPARLIREDRDR